MSEQKRNAIEVTLYPEQMKQLARYELTVDQLVDDAAREGNAQVRFVCPEVYSYTLEDLQQALLNLRKANPTVQDFWDNWFEPLNGQEQAFDLDRARGLLEDEDDTPEYLREYTPALPVCDSAYFLDIWWGLESIWEDGEADDRFCDVMDVAEMLEDLDRYAQNKGKPIEEWQFTRQEKENYIAQFDDDDFVKIATENQLALCRSFVEELCGAYSVPALRAKGYACYGGNRLYPCDWNTARDCITRLFEKTGDPQYVNSLGYICYYGRCNGGTPEYDKAFSCFSLAAANGLYEGIYKLADLYRYGNGCQQSVQTARNLYGMVYESSYKNFLKGHEANFADAALRMGDVFAYGIGEEEDPLQAYCYYLQADYAAKLRAADSDFFGHATVVKKVQKAIEALLPRLPEDYFDTGVAYKTPYLFEQLAEGGNRCLLTRTTKEDGSTVLTVARRATRGNEEPDRVLLTVPVIQYCSRRRDCTLRLLEPAALWFKDDAACVKFDFCEMNWVEQRYEFYNDDELVAYVNSEWYGMEAAENPEPVEPDEAGESGDTE
jgi:hypothetical protein